MFCGTSETSGLPRNGPPSIAHAPDGDHELRAGRRVVRRLQRRCHVADSPPPSRRGRRRDAATRRTARRIAPGRTRRCRAPTSSASQPPQLPADHRSQPQRAPEQALHLRVERPRAVPRGPSARSGHRASSRHAMIRGKRSAPARAARLLGPEQARARHRAAASPAESAPSDRDGRGQAAAAKFGRPRAGTAGRRESAAGDAARRADPASTSSDVRHWDTGG